MKKRSRSFEVEGIGRGHWYKTANSVKICCLFLLVHEQSLCEAYSMAVLYFNILGTTRDTFKGKRVLQLDYEAYIPMAEKELRKICKDIRSKWDVVKIAVIHRIG